MLFISFTVTFDIRECTISAISAILASSIDGQASYSSVVEQLGATNNEKVVSLTPAKEKLDFVRVNIQKIPFPLLG